MDKKSFIMGVVFASMSLTIIGYGMAQTLKIGDTVTSEIRYGVITKDEVLKVVDKADWEEASNPLVSDIAKSLNQCRKNRDLNSLENARDVLDSLCPLEKNNDTMIAEMLGVKRLKR